MSDSTLCRCHSAIIVRIANNCKHFNLSSAIDSGKFEEFIQQAEAEGIGATDMKGFDSTLSSLLKPKQSEGQTLHSSSPDDSSEN